MNGSGLASLTRKAGPLPVWAWAAIIVGAYYLFEHNRKKGSTPQVATVATTGIDPFTGIPYSQELTTATAEVTAAQTAQQAASSAGTAATSSLSSGSSRWRNQGATTSPAAQGSS